MPDVAIGLGPRQLAEHSALRVAGSMGQHQQRQRHAESDALQDAQCQLSGDDNHRESKLPTVARQQVVQIFGLR